MAKRTFKTASGGKVVPIVRDGDDQAKEYAAAVRLALRSGEVEAMVQMSDGSWRNAGDIDADYFDDWDDVEDLWDYLDSWIDENAYGGGEAQGVSIVVR